MKSGKESKKVIAGIFLLFGLHFAVFFILGTLAYIISTLTRTYIAGQIVAYGFFYIGLFQLLYVIPAVIRLKQKHNGGIIKGTIIGALMTIVLNIVGLVLWLSSLQ